MPKNKIHPLRIKEKARKLRTRGWSLGEISKELLVPKNTVSVWVKNISLTAKQKKRIKDKEIISAAKGRIIASKLLRKKMENWKESIRKRVCHFGKMPFEDRKIGKLICGVLYLCEGGKYPSGRQLSFVNSDPKMIKFFLSMLRKYFPINEKKFRCKIQHRYDQDSKELRKFWSDITQISLDQFHKEYIDKRTLNNPTRKRNYKGTCNLQYHSTNLQFELQAIGEAVINHTKE